MHVFDILVTELADWCGRCGATAGREARWWVIAVGFRGLRGGGMVFTYGLQAAGTPEARRLST